MQRFAVRWLVPRCSTFPSVLGVGTVRSCLASAVSRRVFSSIVSGPSTGFQNTQTLAPPQAQSVTSSSGDRESLLSGKFFQLCRSTQGRLSPEQRKELEALAKEIAGVCGDLAPKELAQCTSALGLLGNIMVSGVFQKLAAALSTRVEMVSLKLNHIDVSQCVKGFSKLKIRTKNLEVR
eukprot:RCo020966